MERRKREVYEGTRYPDIRACVDRRKLLKGLGAATGVVAVSTATGCIVPHVMGMIADPDPDTYQASLPPAPDVQTLYLEWQGTIDYHVVTVVSNQDLFLYLQDECNNLLQALDQVLSTHTIHEFEPGSDYTVIEAELMQTLADAYEGILGAPTDDFVTLEFIVDFYDEEEQIDGDIADSK